jgi:ABC-2 type transport system permease protein
VTAIDHRWRSGTDADPGTGTGPGAGTRTSAREATTAGTARLVRLFLRLDRLRLTLWIAGIVALIVASAASIDAVYDTQASVDNYAAFMGDNPATIAMAGPGYGFDDPTAGTVLANETALWAAIALALMSIFLLVRHTRGDEEAERTELVRSSVVGRHAPLAAALIVVTGANLVAGAAIAAGIAAFGFDLTGALAMAAASAATGLVFAGAAAVAAQTATTARGALGIASALLGSAFVVRAVGDIGDGTLTWLSPIGWAQAVRSFADERWWTVALSVGVAIGLCLLALVLETHRDHGGGLVNQRPGPARGRAWMAHPSGLAARLQRGSLIGWSTGLFLLGLVYGSVARDIERILDDSPEMADFLAQVGGASITDAYYATTLLIITVVGTGFSLSSALRLRGEETGGRAEPVLATPVSRTTWALGGLSVTVAGTLAVVTAGGLGLGLGNAAMTGEIGELPGLLAGALLYVPAMLLLVGVAVAAFGLVPRGSGAVWAVLAAVVVIALFGEMLRLPAWLRQVSPFEHVPALPAESFTVLPLAVLSVLAAALTTAGLLGLRSRDVG